MRDSPIGGNLTVAVFLLENKIFDNIAYLSAIAEQGLFTKNAKIIRNFSNKFPHLEIFASASKNSSNVWALARRYSEIVRMIRLNSAMSAATTLGCGR
jgi:hypothetical protein